MRRLLLLSALYSIPSSALIFGDTFYLGIAVGASFPTTKDFKFDKTNPPAKSDITASIKNSSLYSIKGGWSFIPGFSIEFAGDYRKKLPLQINLQNSSASKEVRANEMVGMVNIVYSLIDVKGIAPYAFAGLGIARIKFDSAKVMKNDQNRFELKKGTSIAPAWQVGVGVTKAIMGDFVKIDGSVSLRSARSLKGECRTLGEGGEFSKVKFKQTFNSLNVKLGLVLSI